MQKHNSLDLLKNKGSPDLAIVNNGIRKPLKLPKLENTKVDLTRESQENFFTVQKKSIQYYDPKKDFSKLKRNTPKEEHQKLNSLPDSAFGKIKQSIEPKYFDIPIANEKTPTIFQSMDKRDLLNNPFTIHNSGNNQLNHKECENKISKLEQTIQEKETLIGELMKELVFSLIYVISGTNET